MTKPKIITICGSLKFQKEQMQAAWDLELLGNNVVIAVTYFPPGMSKETTTVTDEETKKWDNIHKHKIDLADAIYVVNIGGYVGSSTQSEIEYAKKHGKEIIYHEPVN